MLRLTLASVMLVGLSLVGCGDAADPDPAPTAEPAPATPVADSAAPDTTDAVTVVFFGDSLTAGYGLANPGREAYPARVGERLAEAGVDAQIVNAGSSGETSAGGLRRVDWVLRRSPPDVFVLALGANDMLRGQPPAATRENLTAIVAKVRAAAPEAEIVIAGMEALPNLGADYVALFRAVFRDLADETGAAFVPFLLDGVGGVAALNQPDGVHPTAEGHARMAETVWPELEGAARRAAG